MNYKLIFGFMLLCMSIITARTIFVEGTYELGENSVSGYTGSWQGGNNTFIYVNSTSSSDTGLISIYYMDSTFTKKNPKTFYLEGTTDLNTSIAHVYNLSGVWTSQEYIFTVDYTNTTGWGAYNHPGTSWCRNLSNVINVTGTFNTTANADTVSGLTSNYNTSFGYAHLLNDTTLSRINITGSISKIYFYNDSSLSVNYIDGTGVYEEDGTLLSNSSNLTGCSNPWLNNSKAQAGLVAKGFNASGQQLNYTDFAYITGVYYDSAVGNISVGNMTHGLVWTINAGYTGADDSIFICSGTTVCLIKSVIYSTDYLSMWKLKVNGATKYKWFSAAGMSNNVFPSLTIKRGETAEFFISPYLGGTNASIIMEVD